MKKPTERNERLKNSLKTEVRLSKRKYVLIAIKNLPLQAIDRYSAQRNVVNRQEKIRKRQTEKWNGAITITVSVNVRCVAVFTGLHTVSRNSVPRNAKR